MEAQRFPRIGELLVANLILTDLQVNAILCAQSVSGRPFGYLAEQMFGVSRAQVEGAWAKQYLSYQTKNSLGRSIF